MAHHRSIIPFILVAGTLLVGSAGIAAAQGAETVVPLPVTAAAQMVADFNTAMAAFESGDYNTTATKLEGIVAKAGPGAQLESVYFTLGAAYYNEEKYAQAASTLKTYVEKYPKGARILDAIFSLGQAELATQQYQDAAAQFSKLEKVPKFREHALYYEGIANKQDGKPQDAIKALSQLITPEIRTPLAAKGAMLLAGIYGDNGQADKATDLMEQILKRTDLVENIVRLNSMAVQLGDSLLQGGRPKDALEAYRAVKSKAEVVAFQKDRLAIFRKRFEQNLTALRANPKDAMEYIAANNELKSEFSEAKGILDDANKLPDFAAALLVRIGQAYYAMGGKWEASLVYNELVTKYPDAKERETALFGEMVATAESNRLTTTRKLAESYLHNYPKGPNAETVGYLMGTTALRANDPQTAETYFGRMLNQQPDGRLSEDLHFLLASSKFAQGKFDDAATDYAEYLKEYPKGTHVEEATYRIAAGKVFAGKYEEAMPLLDSYLTTYPNGRFAPDAKYRIAVCLYAGSQYDDVLAKTEAWEKEYSDNEMLGEVLALRADSLAAQGKEDEAIPVYVRSYKAATTDEVLNYSLFAAEKLLQKKGDWKQISEMFREFVDKHPEHPTAVLAMFWIGKAMARLGQLEEARHYLATNIEKFLDDPKRDGVEPLITQLAQLCLHRPPSPVPPAATPAASPAASPANSAPPVPTPTPEPTPAYDPMAKITSLLNSQDQSPTAQARLLFARSEMARLMRQPQKAESLLLEISDENKPDDLSAYLMAMVGDMLMKRQQPDKAQKFFQALLTNYPKSDVVDFAYSGLGEIAYQKKAYPLALKYFSDAIDEGHGAQKLKDLTVGRAKTLLALNRLDEAQKEFEQVAATREWRGESTAFAVYSLGEIQFKRGDWTKANACFQRVYVAYQKFLPWVAKSYLMSAECFEKLGKTPDAVRTYQEMLRNDKLATFEETGVARKKLEAMKGAQG
jgi:TolA-binding protein